MSESQLASNGNAVLDALPAEVRQQLDIETAHCATHDILIDEDRPAEWVYFPHRGAIVSLVRSTESGATVEVGVIGGEGIASAPSVLAPTTTGSTAMVQISGTISRARIENVRKAMDDNAEARDVLMKACGAFLVQVSQHAVCNRVHSIEQRLSKWLLGVRDRIESDRLDLTHEFLSHMLGIRRSGVTVAIGALALDGAVAHGRNSITILDRDALEARACECYEIMREAMLPSARVEE